MAVYDKLNKKNAKNFMEKNYHNDEIYTAVYNAVRTLGIAGFKDMDKLFEFMCNYDGELYLKKIMQSDTGRESCGNAAKGGHKPAEL